jgi:aromatic ring-opening dioxygenase catalytic subunit (LigB family)
MIYRRRRRAASPLLQPVGQALQIPGIPMKLPTLYLPHGGGPCFYMDWTMGPADTWDRMAAWLRGIDATLPERPRALLVVSAHWEAPVPTVTTSAAPPLFYDYYGFPPHTYELQ